MSERLDKYWVIEATSTLRANEKISKFEKQGYKLLDVKPYNGIGGSCFLITMYLDTGNYDGVTNLKDVSSVEVDTYLLDGWEIASASISTKFCRMIKRNGVTPRLSVIREAIVNAYSVVENWDVKDGNLSNNILKALDVALDEIEGKQHA